MSHPPGQPRRQLQQSTKAGTARPHTQTTRGRRAMMSPRPAQDSEVTGWANDWLCLPGSRNTAAPTLLDASSSMGTYAGCVRWGAAVIHCSIQSTQTPFNSCPHAVLHGPPGLPRAQSIYCCLEAGEICRVWQSRNQQ
mmetsp:Transcript_65887/g.129873  ORF Transcript_65887/g.129873 Transcript_65887/m.129873 type:complete len:138 (-) Transcript_65887:29-442(-)